ncbi:MAG: dipeptidase [Candidatus Rokuibacteriota bacterium]
MPGPACCLGDGATRRAFLGSLLGAVAAACVGPTAAGSARRERDLMAQAADLVASAPTIDLHAHPGAFTRQSTGQLPTAALEDMQAGGVDAAFFSVVTDGPVIRREPGGIRNFREPREGELYRSALGQAERVRRRAQEGRLKLLLEPGDVAVARGLRVPGALLALEGGDALEGMVARVREFHALGVRSIQLMHYRINELGDIQTAPPRHAGLTPRGHDVLAEMNRLGIVVDGAHASPATLHGILAASRTPIIISHTGPAALRPYARHLSDDLIRVVAARAGVIGVWPLSRTGPGPLDQMLVDIDHVRRLVGIEHVGIGTDMEGLSQLTVMPTYRHFTPLPAALLARGYGETELGQLLGGNLMRVFEAATAARA